MSDEGMIHGTVPLVFTRLGLDAGSEHVRARVGIDVGFYEYIPADLMATAAVAYQW